MEYSIFIEEFCDKSERVFFDQFTENIFVHKKQTCRIEGKWRENCGAIGKLGQQKTHVKNAETEKMQLLKNKNHTADRTTTTRVCGGQFECLLSPSQNWVPLGEHSKGHTSFL